jgi:streptogramin lyase
MDTGRSPSTPWLRRLAALAALGALTLGALGAAEKPQLAERASPTSSDWLSLLPDGVEKRRFILDCTGCHQLDLRFALREGRPRHQKTWTADIARMLRMAGAQTFFPVIAHDRDSVATAAWLARHLTKAPPTRKLTGKDVVSDVVTEYDMPEPKDLPHDLVVDSRGRVIVTGMFTHRMFVLEPATKKFEPMELPIERANPRAVDIDSTGAWWVALGAPQSLTRYDPETREWRTFPIGFYPHSLALGRRGETWANGHFTRDPELIRRVRWESGQIDSVIVPPHPTLGSRPGGPIPYEIRIGPDGRVWGSELQGNRLFVHDPERKTTKTYDMPLPHSGPRRFDIDREGVLWIPAYAANELVRFDPGRERFDRYRLPIPDAVPYVVRIDHGNGRIWIGTAAADAVLAFDSGTKRFTIFPLPSTGALVRHLAIDPRTHDLWIAYGASPGPLPARIAMIRHPGPP